MTKKVERLRAPVDLLRWISIAVASASRICALSFLGTSLASAGAPPPGISLFSEERDLSDVSVGVDLDGDGAIRDLLGNGVVPGDEVLFGQRVETTVGHVEPTARLFFTLPGAVSEMNDSVVATISGDGKSLNVQGSGSCSSETAASGFSFVSGRHDLIFRMGSPGTFRATGTISASPLRETLVPPDELDVVFQLSGGAEVVVINGDGFSGEASFDESGVLRTGGFELFVSCGMNSDRREGGGGGPRKEASWEFNVDVTLDETADECLGAVLKWVGSRGGAFADPASWEPPQVPVFEEGGRCDTAVVQGGRNVTIDLAAAARSADPRAALDPRAVVRKTGRFVVDHSEGARTTGGRLELDALSPVLGERSLEIGSNASLLLQDDVVVARHVAVGTSGAGEVDVAGDNGFFETGGRLGLGADGEGRLVVRDGATAQCAEMVIGEVSAQGSVLVEGTRSLLSTGNLAVGLAHDGLLEVLSGARVESEEAHVDVGLEGDELAFATVHGKDAQGNRSTWKMESLTIGPRGQLDVEDGGLVDVADELLVPFKPGSSTGVVQLLGSQLSAGGVAIEAGSLLVAQDDALLFVPGTIQIGSESSPSAAATLLVVGPASASQIDAPDLLSVEGIGRVQLTSGAKVNLLGTFNVGTTTLDKALLEVVAGDSGTGALSLLRANEAGDFHSQVGAESSAPAGQALAPTGELRLTGGRVELLGLSHSLVVERTGLLRGSGEISIQEPGALFNNGVVDGDFVLEGDYVQEAQGTRHGTILAVSGPPAGSRVLDPLAAVRFPRVARAKPALPAFRPLVVTGDATLDGRVELQFGNGVAPRAGDAFDVLEVAGTVTGQFAEVAIHGLVPGSFAFESSLVGGKLSLTSTKDAVALPAVSVKAKARLKETAKRGGKIKLKRTGDTSAPLVVSYTVGGTAQSGVDYEALPGTIEFPAKKKSATILVRPIADGLIEGPETLELELVPGDSYAPGAVSQVAVEILSKDE